MNGESNLQNKPMRLTVFLTSFLVWLMPSLIGFIAKIYFLDSQHGFANVAGALSVKTLSLGQQLSFFRADLVFALILLPFCFLIVRLLLPTRLYSWTVGTAVGIAVLLQLLAFAELAVIGNLAPGGLLGEGLEWGIDHPMAALEFLLGHYSLSSYVQAVVAVGGATIAVFFAWRIIKRRRQVIKKHIHSAAAVFWIACAPLAIAAWFPWMRPTVFHSPMIALVVQSLLRSDVGAGKYQGLSIDTLRPIHNKLLNVPDQNSPGPYWGAAKGYDVVFVIMETGPAHILLADTSFKDFPNLKRLSQSSWVGMQHYTTSPESYKAVTSILLSMYPPTHTRSFADKPLKLPGLIQSLNAAGYQTGVYLPDVQGTTYAKLEQNYYKMLGPDRVSVDDAPLVPKGTSKRWQEVENLDLAALRELESDFRASTSSGKRFFGIYLPQLSHEPWADVTTGDDEHNMAKRRYNLMELEDHHLGELIATIQKLGRLDNTLIVVACDHGLRSSESDSSFRLGQVDDLTFHVPLLVYAPGIVREQTNLPWVTSHIDISPTILSLLGISEGREFEAGTPIWNEGLKDRCLFFFASQYFGADGYSCSGSFSMWNPLLNVAYTGQALHFTASQTVSFDSQAYKDIVDRFQAMDALRNAWFESASSAHVGLATSALTHSNR